MASLVVLFEFRDSKIYLLSNSPNIGFAVLLCMDSRCEMWGEGMKHVVGSTVMAATGPGTGGVFEANFDLYVRGFHVYEHHCKVIEYSLALESLAVEMTKVGITVAKVMVANFHFVLSIVS